LKRAVAAQAGIYGNDAVEAMYPLTRVDGDGQTLDGSKHNYTLTFPPDQQPPSISFWSLTMYDGRRNCSSKRRSTGTDHSLMTGMKRLDVTDALHPEQIAGVC